VSTRYFYKLRGNLVTLSKKLLREKGEMQEKRNDYYMENGLDKDFGCLSWYSGDLAGVPSIYPLPKHFKYVNGHGKSFMCPRLSTKLGKKEDKKWEDLKFPKIPEEICKKVGISTYQFIGMGLFFPQIFVTKDGHFLVSTARIKDDKNVLEISAGKFDDIIEEHNDSLDTDGVK